MMPAGLHDRQGWIASNFDRCFELMECDDERLFQKYIANWRGLMDFETVPVKTSEEMQSMPFPQE